MRMEKNTLEEMYKKMMKETLFGKSLAEPDNAEDRFKSILHPDYSDYTTSTITGSIC